MYEFEAEVWLWEGEAAWHFVTVPDDISEEIEDRSGPPTGFGSVRVRVTIGESTWATSVFPDKKRRAYVLPLKKPVRLKEAIGTGDPVKVTLELISS